ncbi:MAG: hydrogenase expression/formation protein HypE [Gammaproteobacteria bacterium 28-57-27]|nr:MAG: hydrogenase expression/formation protein HypE [Gammaproteobacteria bacterium 28-57-27]
MSSERITLAHGNGGRLMRELIEGIFARHLGNPALDTERDAAELAWPSGRLMFTTDGFTVQPLEFPGGSIGSLAVHGVVNDLAVSGARARYLSVAVLLEEGLELALLERIVMDLAAAARACGVRVVAGDTKVVRRGEGGGIYLTLSAIGEAWPGPALGMAAIRPGDAVLVSGAVGDHGAAVMLAREQFGLRGGLRSDSASVLPLAEAAMRFDGLRFMRDPTRGGLATVMHEIAAATGLGVRLSESAIPVRQAVAGVCELLGFDPLFLACEGRVVAVVDHAQADAVLEAWRGLAEGQEAARIGCVVSAPHGLVLATELGERMVQELEDDPLPRIC